jgi:signal transduction histidine kinase
VFRNILENALAASRDPVRIVIDCGTESCGGHDAFRVRIRDNGPGFATKDISRVFEPFYTTKTHGTGLGLAICKRIVDAHGGSIAAGNAPDGGAEITIILPRRPQ